MTYTVPIVQCGKQKVDTREDDNPDEVPAEDLYTAGYFTVKRRLAEALVDAHGGDWLILSAEHGFVHHETPLSYYDTEAGEEGFDWDEWLGLLRSQAIDGEKTEPRTYEALRNADEIVLLTGAKYGDRAVDVLTGIGGRHEGRDQPAVTGAARGPGRHGQSDGVDEQARRRDPGGRVTMGVDPRTPDGFDMSPYEAVGEWTLDREEYNGFVWFGPARETAVRVSTMDNEAQIQLRDERAGGYESNERLDTVTFDRDDKDERLANEAAAVATAVEQAADWMAENVPSDWSHPAVCGATLEAPAGYVLEDYALTGRYHDVYYRREDADPRWRLAGAYMPDEVTPETFPYLRIRTWRGSGNSDVWLAPWRSCHDEECEPIRDPPEECGLDVALAMAREFARDVADVAVNGADPSAGQTDLLQFAEVGQ